MQPIYLLIIIIIIILGVCIFLIINKVTTGGVPGDIEDDLDSILQSMIAQVEMLESCCQELAEVCGETDENLKKLKVELENCKKENTDLKAEKEKLSKRLDQIKHDSQATIAQKELLLFKLNEELTKLQGATPINQTDVDNKKREIDDAELIIKTFVDTIKVETLYLEKSLLGLDIFCTQNREQINNLNRNIDGQGKMLALYLSKKDNLSTEIVELKSQLKTQNDKLIKIQQIKQSIGQNIKNAIDQLNSAKENGSVKLGSKPTVIISAHITKLDVEIVNLTKDLKKVTLERDKLTNVEKQLESVKAQVKRLQEANNILRVANSQMSSDALDKCNLNLQKALVEIEKLKKEDKGCRDSGRRIHAQLSELESYNAELKATYDLMSKANGDLEQSVKTLQSSVATLNLEKTKLYSENARLAALIEGLKTEKIQTIEAFEKQIADLRAENEKQRKGIEKYKNEEAKCRKRLTEIEQDRARLQKAAFDHNLKKLELERKLDLAERKATSAVDAENTKLANEIAFLKRRLQDLTISNDRYVRKIAESTQKLAELTNSLEDYMDTDRKHEGIATQMQNEIFDLQTENAKLRDDLGGDRTEHKKIFELNAQIDAERDAARATQANLAEEISQLEKTVRENRHQINNYKRTIEQKNKDLQDLEALKFANAELNAKINEYEAKVQAINAILSKLLGRNISQDDIMKIIKSIEEDFERQNVQIKILSGELRNGKIDNDILIEKLEQSKKRVDVLVTDLVLARGLKTLADTNNAVKVNDLIADYNRQLDDLQRQLLAALEQNRNQQNQIARLAGMKMYSASLRQRMLVLETQLEDKTKDYDVVLSMNDVLRDTLNAIKIVDAEKIEKLNNKIDVLEAQILAINNDKTDLQQQIAVLNQQIQLGRDDCLRKLSECEKEKEVLKDEIVVLKDELDKKPNEIVIETYISKPVDYNTSYDQNTSIKVLDAGSNYSNNCVILTNDQTNFAEMATSSVKQLENKPRTIFAVKLVAPFEMDEGLKKSIIAMAIAQDDKTKFVFNDNVTVVFNNIEKLKNTNISVLLTEYQYMTNITQENNDLSAYSKLGERTLKFQLPKFD